MRKFLLFPLILFANICLFSQPLTFSENQTAHRKYWFYRTRFINDFVNIGDKQGDCICLPERNYNYTEGQNSIHNYNNYYSKIGPDQIDIMNQYLSALALEYKILSRAHQSTEETLKEIFYILKTYNRLDIAADQFWGANPPSNDHLLNFTNNGLNGFMLREDMPHDYFNTGDPNTPAYYQSTSQENYQHFNYGLKEYNNTATDANISYSGLHKTNKLTYDNKFSNYTGFGSPPLFNQVKPDLSCVMDKYFSMFNAFMFLIKYIPDNTAYYENNQLQTFQDNESDIKQEIRNITNRCHLYIRGNTFGGPGSNWVLEYPDGNNLAVGANAIPYSYPLAKMICYINGGYPYSWPCNSYQDGNSITTGFALYNVLYLNPIPPSFPTLGSEDAAVFLDNVMAGSNAPVYINNFPWIIPANVAIDVNTSINSTEWADLMRRVHHQSGILLKSKSVYANPINQAPCKGPYNFGPGNDPGFEWRSQDRLEHPKHRLANHPPPPGNYPGVDYMLLHNLYYEYLNQQDDNNDNQTAKYKNAYNLMDNYDEQIWPQKLSSGPNPNSGFTWGVNQIGPNKSPMYVKVFQNLKSNAVIYATASPLAPNNNIPSKVEYRAGKEIVLLPEDPTHPAGFEVKLGSDFHAYIERYVCGVSDYENGMRQNSNGQNTAYNNDYERDTMNMEVPIHYIKGQKSDSDLYPNGTEVDYSNMSTAEEMQQQLLEQYNLANALKDQSTIDLLEAEAQKHRFIILPNPNNGIFKVFANRISDSEIFTLTIFDMKGQPISNFQNLNENLSMEINLSNHSKGIYMVSLTSNLGFTSNKKVSVQ